MNLEFYKIAATNQLEALCQTIHEKAANASKETIKTAQVARIAIVMLTAYKAIYDCYNGNHYSYIITVVAGHIASSAIGAGVNYVQAVQTSQKTSDLIELKK